MFFNLLFWMYLPMGLFHFFVMISIVSSFFRLSCIGLDRVIRG